MRTTQPASPVISEMIAPRIAGSTSVATRVWMRPIGVGHIQGLLGELLRFADLLERLRGRAGQLQLHGEAAREGALAEPLRANAVADEAPRDVLEPRNRVAVRDDGVRVDPHHRQ